MSALATEYMGLALRNPLVASPSPLSSTFEGVQRLAAGGVGAIVLYSLFEEQLASTPHMSPSSSTVRPRASPRRSTTSRRWQRRTRGFVPI